MNTDYTLGICIDNNDPNNYGRIRVVNYNAYKNYLSVNGIKEYVDSNSDNNTKYTIWSDGVDTNNLPDEDVAEPFLPHNLNVIPLVGQVVRLITDSDNKKLYVGPITSTPTDLKTIYRDRLTENRSEVPSNIANRVSDTNISGFNNEQISLGGNRALIRLDHINNKTKKTQYPIFQISKLNKSLDYKEVTKTVTKVKDVFLDYMIELEFNYSKKNSLTDKNIQCVISIYNTINTIVDNDNKKGLTKNKYNKHANYLSGNSRNQYTVRHVLDFNEVEAMDKTIEEILSAYKTKKIKYFNPDTPNNNQLIEANGNIRLINKISAMPNNGGGVNSTLDIVTDLNNAVIRISPLATDLYSKPSSQLQKELLIPNTQPSDTLSLDYVRFSEFNNFIRKIRKYGEGRFTGTQNLQPPQTTTIKSVEEEVIDKSVTTQVMYADKFLLLSSLNSPNYLDSSDKGMNNDTVSKFLSGISNDGSRDYNTYGWVRGEKMLELINRLISIVLTHGHSIGQVEDSINVDARKLLSNLTSELNQEINGNKLNQPTKIINHNLRIN